jgi:hypothetical protein
MLTLIEEEQKERDEFNAILACDSDVSDLTQHGAR